MTPKNIKESTGQSNVLKRSLSSIKGSPQLPLLLAALLAMLFGTRAWGQAPSLAWANSNGGQVFAADASNNVYASSNGTVLKLSPAGIPLQTNAICPLPGFAQRDAAGNYYFLGSFDGTQNFGGITLVGGWTNHISGGKPTYQSGWPTCFLAMYAGNGSLQWVISFGQQSFRNKADDLALNPDGSLTVAFDTSGTGFLSRFSASGSNIWQTAALQQLLSTIKVSRLTGTNGAFLEYNGNANTLAGGFYDPAGNTALGTSGPAPLPWQNALALNAEPVIGISNDLFVTDFTFPNPTRQPMLMKWKAQSLESSQVIGTVEQWTLTGDSHGNIYLAGVDGSLAKYTGNGTLIWSTNYGSPTVSMLLDNAGNRYISRNDGSIAKLQDDLIAAPVITNAPSGGVVFVGSNFTFNVGASGYAPLNYYWLYQSNALAASVYISGAANASLALTSLTASASGLYSVIVSNIAGTATSAPATLAVKSVELFQGTQMLANGTYHYGSPPTFSLHSAYVNGQSFYSLDGSTPDFTSTPYSGPFTISNNATVNAIGYSADFSQSEYADTVTAIVPSQYALAATTAGGGTVSLNPAGGAYASNTVVTATANPAAGFSFLAWQGAATGANPVTNILMNQNQSLNAVFGTTLSTTVAGNGQVLPALGSNLYPYGTVVRLEALPQAGNYFALWGNAASGNTNPLYFTVINANQTVSSLFSATPTNKAALTLLVLGQGKAAAIPVGNLFTNTQSVTITATPNSGQSFLSWSGDASGTQNPLTVSMSQSRVIIAHFSGQSVTLSSAANAFTAQGFQLMVGGDPQAVYQILSSTNLTTWQNAGMMTNGSGQTQFTDPTATNAPMKYYRAMLTQ